MAKDLLTLANDVNYTVGNDPNLLSEAKIWVDRAYRYLATIVELPEMQATTSQVLVVATNSYALPSDFFSVYSLRNSTDQTVLRQVTLPEFDNLNTTTQANPEIYALDHQNFYLWPTPDETDTLQLRYRKSPVALTADTDEHVLDEVWNQPLVLLACAFGFDYRNELERATAYRRNAFGLIRTQEKRHAANLFDLDAAVAMIGTEIN